MVYQRYVRVQRRRHPTECDRLPVRPLLASFFWIRCWREDVLHLLSLFPDVGGGGEATIGRSRGHSGVLWGIKGFPVQKQYENIKDLYQHGLRRPITKCPLFLHRMERGGLPLPHPPPFHTPMFRVLVDL